MTLKQIRDDACGAAMVEFAIALPVFTLIIFGLIWLGFLMWTEVSLQRSVQLAARCATIAQNTSLAKADCNNVSVVAPPTSTSIQTFALTQYWGLGVPKYTASLTTTTATVLCGTNPGNLVSAKYTFSLISLFFLKASPTLTAQSCSPV